MKGVLRRGGALALIALLIFTSTPFTYASVIDPDPNSSNIIDNDQNNNDENPEGNGNGNNSPTNIGISGGIKFIPKIANTDFETDLQESTISFYTKDENEVVTELTQNEILTNGCYTFVEEVPTDTEVFYKIVNDNYKTINDSVTTTEEPVEVEIEFKEKDSINLSCDAISLPYGSNLDILNKCEYNPLYDDEIKAEVIDGDNFIRIDNNTTIVANTPGDAKIKVTAHGNDEFKQEEIFVDVTVTKSGGVKFVSNDITSLETILQEATITFYTKDENENQTILATNDMSVDNCYTFSENVPIGTTVYYEIKHDSNKTITGSVVTEATPVEAEISFTEKDSPELSCDAISLSYESQLDILDKCHRNEAYDGEITAEIIEGDTQIRIENNTTVVAVMPGTAKIKIKASSTDNFSQEEITVDVTVTKKDLGDVDNIRWSIESPEKQYDGNAEYEMEGIYNGEDNLQIVFKATLTAISKDAGTWDTTATVDEITSDNKDYYAFGIAESPQLTITPIEAEITIDSKSVTYGDDEWSTLKNGLIPDGWDWIHATLAGTGVYQETVIAEFNQYQPSDYANVNVIGPFDAGSAEVEIEAINTEDANFHFTVATENPVITINKATARIIAKNKTVTYGDAEWNDLTQQKIPVTWDDLISAEIVSPNNQDLQTELDFTDPATYATVTIKRDRYLPGLIENAIIVTAEEPENSNFTFTTENNADINVLNQVQTDDEVWSQIQFNQHESVKAYKNDKIWIGPGGTAKFDVVSDTYNQVIFNVNESNSINEIYATEDDSISGTAQLQNSFDPSIVSDADASTPEAEPNRIPENYILMDRTAPVIVFTDELGTYSTADPNKDETMVFNELTMVKYSKTGYTTSVRINDTQSGVGLKKYKIIKVENQNDAEQKIKDNIKDYETWENIPENGRIQVPGTEDGYYMIAVGSQDNVGNALVATSNGIVIDVTVPTLTIIGIEDKIYNEDIPFTVVCSDVGGLKNLKVTAKADTEEVLYNETDTDNKTITELIGTSKRIPLNIDSKKFNSNYILITATAEDKSGNTVKVTEIARIDVSGMEIEVSYNDNNPKNQRYFNNNRIMTVTFKGRNFDPEKAGFTININGTGERTFRANEVMEGEGVQLIQDRKDSQANRTIDTYTDDRTNTYVYAFTGLDVDYNIKPWAEGVEFVDYGTSNPTNNFTIDKVPAELKADFSTEGRPFIINENPYTNENVKAEFTAIDRNYTNQGFSVVASGTNAEGSSVQINPQSSIDENVFTDIFQEDANYIVSVKYTDLAGNVTTLNPFQFTIDKTGPTGVIKYAEKTSDALNLTTKFTTFSKNKITFTCETNDETAGIDQVLYAIYNPDAEERDTFTVVQPDSELLQWAEWNDVKVNQRKQNEQGEQSEQDEQAIVYAKIIDKAGNVTYLNTEGVIVDRTSPAKPIIQIQNETTAYNENVPFSFYAEDLLNDNTYSGLKSIKWSVKSNGRTTQSGEYTFEDSAKRVHHETFDEVINAQANNGNVTIEVTAEDYAGNTATQTETLEIDITKPTVTLSYDNNRAENEKYFNKQRVLTISIKERDYVPAKTFVEITINGKQTRMPIEEFTGYGITQVQGRQETGTGDNCVNTYKFAFGAEGNIDADYKINVVTEDVAGNQNDGVICNSTAGLDFTIDEVAPVLSYQYNDGMNTDQSIIYTRENVTEKFFVTERNYKENGYRVTVTGKDYEGTPIPISNYGTVEDKVYTTSTFDQDANYNTTVTYTDLAGNTTSLTPVPFTIDKTPPTGKISYATNKESSSIKDTAQFTVFNKENVAFAHSEKDATSGVENVMYSIYKPDVEARETFAVPSLDELENMPWILWNNEVKIEKDAQGVVYAKITDKAGNVTYLNTDGVIAEGTKPNEPQIIIQTLKSVYNNDVPFTIKVEDKVNGGTYSGLKNVKWTVKNNGQVTQTKEYTFRDGAKRVKNAEYNETIDSKLNNSSNVVIEVIAEDFSGNVSTTSKPIRIDITKPVVTVSFDNNNPRNGSYFNSKRIMTVKIKERDFNPETAIIDLTINKNKTSIPISRFSGYGISTVQDRVDTGTGDERTNTYQFAFGADGNTDADYEIAFRVTDEAGNQNEEIIYTHNTDKAFTIDEVKPQLSYRFVNSDGRTVDASDDPATPYFDKIGMTVSLLLNERNHDMTGLNLHVSGTDYNKKQVPVTTEGTWNNNVYNISTYQEDANYEIYADYTDLAGNKVELPKRYFTTDTMPPTGKLITGDKESTELLNKIAFGTFVKLPIPVREEHSDATSGVAGVYYFKYVPSLESRGEFAIPTIQELSTFEWKEWTSNIQVIPNEQVVVYLKLVDKAGNVRYISSKDGIIADSQSPLPNIEITTTASQGIHNGNVPFRISVSDTVNETYSGLKSVEWKVESNGTVTQSGNFNDELSDSRQRTKSITKDLEVYASMNNSNKVKITVVAEDYSGNKETVTKDLKIDVTPPSISIRYDNNNPQNGKYFNTYRTMTIEYKDRNFDPAAAYITVNINGTPKTMPIGELSGTGITLVSGRVDSESNKSEEEYTDARTNTYVYRFGANGSTDADYTISASITDKAGNKTTDIDYGNSNPATSFTIDEVAPVLNMTFLNSSGNNAVAGTDPSHPYYDRRSMTAIANVFERNFYQNGLALSASAIAGNSGAGINISTAGSWTDSGDMHNYRINTYTEDGIYTIEASYTDLAGNTATYSRHYFVIDKTAPKAKITISGTTRVNSTGVAGTNSSSQDVPFTTSFDTFNNLVAFRLFTNKALKFSQTSTDDTAGIERIQYYLYVPSVESRGTFQGLTLEQMSALPWTDWVGDLVISPNVQVIVYVRVIDKAGNITYMNSKDGIVADDTAPENPIINITADEPRNGIYNKDIPFTIAVSDTERGGTYSGLKSVRWSVLKDGSVTQTGSYDNEFSDRTARTKSTTHNEVVYAKNNDSNNVKIVVEAEDYSGNTSKAEKTLAIDVTKPIVTVTYDKNEPKNELYYNEDRVATITIKERNFSQPDVDVQAKGAIVSGWDHQGDTYTCHATFKDDNEYNVTVKAKDKAGNEADYDRVDHFVIDKISPVISVTFDDKDDDKKDKDKIYYNRIRTAIILVKDANFNEQQFEYNVNGTIAGLEIKNTPKTTSWVHNKDAHSAMLVFEEDGDYTFELSCTDLAGNKAEVYNQSKFTIDRTKPTIRFKNIEDHSANKGVVSPLVEYADLNFDANGIKVTMEGNNHENVEMNGEKKADKNSGSMLIPDFRHTKDVDDIYRLTAEVTDLAGNTGTSTIEFSVNRFGSVYSFSDETKEFLDKYYQQEPEKLTIYETNVDGLRNVGITVGRNGTISKLKNTDYTAETSENNGWTVLKYDLNADCFVDEGLYEVRIESIDAAGNRQDNSLKDKPIAFAIDQTPPSIVVTGIENAARYDETSKEVVIVLNDNIALGNASVYVNDELVQAYDQETIVANGGKISYTMRGSDEWQTIEVRATDAAGNESQSGKTMVFISNNKLRQFLENKPLFYGTIAGGIGAVAAVGAGVFVLRKRKKAGKGKTKELDKDDTSDDLQ